MANFDSRDYEQFLGGEKHSADRQRERANSIREGSHILVFNSAWAGRDPQKEKSWKQVRSVTRFSDGILEIVCTDGARVSDRAVLVVRNSPSGETPMISLCDRRDEFVAALERAFAGDLEVFPDFEQDAFVVVNRENGNEYLVILKTVDGKVFASCAGAQGGGCPDFEYRQRVCKHISVTLRDAFFGILEKVQVAAEVV